jgi:hypothetical protein
VPSKFRGRLAAALPARMVPEMRTGFFHHFFDEGDHFFDEGDPFGFDVNPAEQLKFRRTLEVCGDGPLGRVLALGCAVGSFTELLAPCASDALALDVSPAAAELLDVVAGHLAPACRSLLPMHVKPAYHRHQGPPRAPETSLKPHQRASVPRGSPSHVIFRWRSITSVSTGRSTSNSTNAIFARPRLTR